MGKKPINCFEKKNKNFGPAELTLSTYDLNLALGRLPSQVLKLR